MLAGVFGLTLPLDRAADDCQAMDERRATKTPPPRLTTPRTARCLAADPGRLNVAFVRRHLPL
ncbi:hypothetical protein ACFXP3_13210 [Streptomyces sp. NPDC059096]|uniref:hypothetical protein n=1 Tax=Streptomyces sp. NPDC059096 TaxID=3346727 RepID=UPI003690C293